MNEETLKEYEKEIDAILSRAQNNPMPKWPAIGAEMAATTKRYKSYVIINVLFDAMETHSIDMTPTLANKLTLAMVGRSISRPLLAANFRTEGRTASDKSPDFERFDEIVSLYQYRVMDQIGKADLAMHEVREKVKKKYK